MLHPLRRSLALASLFVLLQFSSAVAGQVRVTVGGASNVFTPSDVSLNPGDHVVFVWAGGFHSVTSGDPGGECVYDNLYFDSGTLNSTVAGRQTTFTWKSPSTTIPTLEYICLPHCPTMAGVLRISPGAAVANFRITELRTNVAGEADLIEITNFGAVDGNLGRYRFVSNADTAIVPANDWVVPAGGRVVVRVNQSGTQVVPSEMFLPTFSGLTDNGFVALYTPNTVNNSVADATQMIDFVQTGAAGSAREGTAVTAGYWTAGTFAPVVASGHSLEFCGTATDRGVTHWAEVSTPNFGVNGGCTTPAAPLSWGRLKMIYR